ncbi:MAG: hypothetical protein LBT80_00305 [Lactobacillaceae bacterium]|jgi:hypothetical protein|nr:hypothetical protein [Lactobacillaceae bacterium]
MTEFKNNIFKCAGESIEVDKVILFAALEDIKHGRTYSEAEYKKRLRTD